MKAVTIYLDAADLDLIHEISPSSTYFFRKCSIMHEHSTMPFAAVAISFIPDRFTRRAMSAMIKDMICRIAEHDERTELICAIAYKFLNYIG